MTERLSSRDRMLEAIACREPDHVPCCFMIFSTLGSQCKNQFEFVERQLELGLDARVGIPSVLDPELLGRSTSDHADLTGLPVRYHPEVRVRDWLEDRPDERYPMLHREYVTPAGTLFTTVKKTEDWVQGDRVPLFDDFVIPRAQKRLVTRHENLDALRYLLTSPSKQDVEMVQESAVTAKAFAEKHGVLIEGGCGSVVDTACWLVGITELVLLALDKPEFAQDLFDLVEAWNGQRMAVTLDAGVDLFVRRGWYESCDLWSRALFQRFILPTLRRDAEIVHQAGARFAYAMTSGQMPLLDMLVDSGIDVLIGLDPVQGKGADFGVMKQKTEGKVCLWGGVNGFLTMELGTPSDVKAEVRHALRTLAPGGGFILSPVDNVTANTDRAWTNIHTLIDEWRKRREYQ